MSAVRTKTCKCCGGPIKSNNYHGYCRKTSACNTARRDDWSARNPAKHKAYKNTYEQRHRVANVVRAMRNRARNLGLDCDVTMANVPDVPKYCPCCNVTMVRGEDRNTTPSLDRIVPAKGYVIGNVQWLCHRCNRIKSDATADELMRLALFMAAIEERQA